MVKGAYVTLMGRSGWAVVNSFHAAIIETSFRPDTIHIIYETRYAKEVVQVVSGLEIIQSTYTAPNVITIEVPNWDALATRKTAMALVSKLNEDGFQIALDVTGGRKALITGALLGLKNTEPNHVFYLAIDTTEGVAKPYLMIPKRIQRLFDLKTGEIQAETATYDSEISTTDIMLTRKCITVLLNQAYSRGEKIVVKTPLIKDNLLELDLESRKIVMLTNRDRYSKKLDSNRFRGADHPSYSDLRRCLIYSGVLPFENQDELLELIKNDFGKTFDQRSGVRRSFLALDANMFGNGFPTTLRRLESELDLKAQDVLCVTSYPTVKEVGKNIRNKYSKEDIHEAKNHYKSGTANDLLNEFLGQNKRKTRMAKMAKAQFSLFKDRPVHCRTDIVDLPPNKEDVDKLVVDALEKFAKQHGVRVTLLSTDKNMLDTCELAEDMGVMILRYPEDIPQSIEVTNDMFVDLLVGLSLLYGVVELEKIGYLFGEYRGKKSEVYTEEIKLRVRNRDRARVLQERISVCKKLDEIGFTR
jgi:hypothetical protein